MREVPSDPNALLTPCNDAQKTGETAKVTLVKRKNKSNNKFRMTNFIGKRINHLMIHFFSGKIQPKKIKIEKVKYLPIKAQKAASEDINTIPVSRMSPQAQIKQYKKNGLSTWEAYFNAYYIFFLRKSRRDDTRQVRDEFTGIAQHPVEWSSDHGVFYKKTKWDFALMFLNRYAAFKGSLAALYRSVRSAVRRAGAFFTESVPVLPFLARSMGTILAVGVIAAVTVTMVRLNSYQVEIQAVVDGKVLGIIDSKNSFDKVLDNLESDISEITQVAYKFGHKVEYRLVRTNSPEYISQTQLYDDLYLYAQDVITPAYGLYVDGSLVGASLSEEEITSALDEMLHAVKKSDGTAEKVEFNSDIEITQDVFPRRLLMSPAELKDLLVYSSEDGILYTKESKLPAPGVSAALQDVSASDAIIRNDASAPSALYMGLTADNTYYIPEDKLAAGANEEIAFKYKTIKTETSTERINYKTIKEDNPDAYAGTQTIKQYGKAGQMTVYDEVSYIDGVEVDRKLLMQEITVEPIPQIVLIGTKPIPTTEPTGTFIKPVDGIYGDGFGTRVLRGEKDYHRAQDFPAKKGTPVYAADSGEVIISEWHPSYGNYVQIRHSNGIETGYAHLDKALVKAGDKVYQGQQIGKVGNTGDSIGYHLHFMVFKNGELVDPVPYIEGNQSKQ